MTTHRKTTHRKNLSMRQLTEWTAHQYDKSWNRHLMDTTIHRYSSKLIKSENKSEKEDTEIEK